MTLFVTPNDTPPYGAPSLRNDVRYNNKTVWSPANWRRIAELKLPNAAQHIAFEEYAQGVDGVGKRMPLFLTCIPFGRLCLWSRKSIGGSQKKLLQTIGVIQQLVGN